MNLRGIKSRKDNKITFNIIHHMLKNRRYLGEYQFRDIIHPHSFPAIVHEELFIEFRN
ncbi:MAG: recombinase family protein [Clostridia bacterium]|nr:recombinase family protein [Clostridia bacterium]